MSLLDERAVVLFTGISAAGKSTVAELLARRFERGVHVKGDTFRRMIVAGREDMTVASSDEAWRQLRLRYRLAAATAEAYHESGFSVVVQDVVIGPVLRDYVDSIRSRPLLVVVLAPRPEVVARREAGRRKDAYGDGNHSIMALDAALRLDTPRLGMWLDTSTQTAEQTADEIVAHGLDQGQVS